MNNASDQPLAIGLQYIQSMRVLDRHTVPKVEPDWPGFSDMPPVLATAVMVGFVEQTCIEGLRPYLVAGQHSVGTHVSVSHTNPTPVGMEITAKIDLIDIDGRKLSFRISISDEEGLIGEGLHERYIIDVSSFMDRVRGKSEIVRTEPIAIS